MPDVVAVSVLGEIDHSVCVAVQLPECAVDVAAQLLVAVVVVPAGRWVLVDCSFKCVYLWCVCVFG